MKSVILLVICGKSPSSYHWFCLMLVIMTWITCFYSE